MKLSLNYRLIDVIHSSVERLSDTPLWAKCGAVCVGTAQVLGLDWLIGLLPIWLLASAADFYYGVRASKKELIFYDSVRATTGVHVKVSGLILVLIIRLLELWLSSFNIANTKGALSVALLFTFVAIDIESIARNRERLGAGPIPILSGILAWIRNAITNLVPGFRAPDGKPERKDNV